MDRPAVTVVLPARDAAGTIAAAVASIRAQTRGDFELLVIDDGSRDDTVAKALAAAGDDPRVRVIRRGRDGLVAALNAGIALSSAPLVARMDADDVSLPRRLECQVELADRRPDLAVIGCRVRALPEEALTDGMRHYLAWLDSVITPDEVGRDLYVESPFAHPSVLMRREVVLAAGGYRDGAFPEDYDLWLRLHAAGHAMGKVPEVLLEWREGPGRLTRTDPRYGADAFRRLKARSLAGTFLAGHAEVQVWGAGPDGRKWRRALAEQGVRVVRFFDIDPRKIGRVLGGGALVLDWRRVPRHRDCPLLVAVGTKGARPIVRDELVRMGFVETVDFRCVQ